MYSLSLVLHDTKVMFEQKLAGFFENFPADVELTQVAPLSYQAKLNGTLTVDSTFDDFVTSFLSQADVPFALVSKADALSTLSIGNVTVQGVDLNQNVSIKGMNLQRKNFIAKRLRRRFEELARLHEHR
jgi:hypothetical protein